ncbi:MAG: hypothetical protein ABJQ71_01090 [Roseibium sp.]
MNDQAERLLGALKSGRQVDALRNEHLGNEVQRHTSMLALQNEQLAQLGNNATAEQKERIANLQQTVNIYTEQLNYINSSEYREKFYANEPSMLKHIASLMDKPVEDIEEMLNLSTNKYI